MDEATAWLNGYLTGSAHLAGMVEACVESGVELGEALLLARLACLNLTFGMVCNVGDRETVVDWFRRGLSPEENTTLEVLQ